MTFEYDDTASTRDQDAIAENKRKDKDTTEDAIYESSKWGDCNQQGIVDVVRKMMKRNTGSMLGSKCNVFWGEIESISEAVNEACIQEGLDEDCYSPSINCEGFEYEIRLY